MENITYKGKEGVFFTDEEFENIKNKILANNDLIFLLMEEVGLNE